MTLGNFTYICVSLSSPQTSVNDKRQLKGNLNMKKAIRAKDTQISEDPTSFGDLALCKRLKMRFQPHHRLAQCNLEILQREREGRTAEQEAGEDWTPGATHKQQQHTTKTHSEKRFEVLFKQIWS